MDSVLDYNGNVLIRADRRHGVEQHYSLVLLNKPWTILQLEDRVIESVAENAVVIDIVKRENAVLEYLRRPDFPKHLLEFCTEEDRVIWKAEREEGVRGGESIYTPAFACFNGAEFIAHLFLTNPRFYYTLKNVKESPFDKKNLALEQLFHCRGI